MNTFKQNKAKGEVSDKCFTASYKASNSGKLTLVSIFAENTSEAVKLAPNSIDMGRKLLYGIS